MANAFYKPYNNYTKPVIDMLDEMLQVMSGNLTEGNVTEQCRVSSSSLVRGAGTAAVWALRIIDASGKPSSGLLEKGVILPGFFTECVDTVIKHDGKELQNEDTGKYCMISLNHTQKQQKHNLSSRWNVLKSNPSIGLCVPSTCTNDDIKYAVQRAIDDIINDTEVTMHTCYTKENDFIEDPAALSMTAILCLVILVVFVGTSYDIVKDSNKSITERYLGKTTASVSTDTIPVTTSSSEILCAKKKPKAKFSRLRDILLCFSLKTNGKKILQTDKAEGSIDALHGIRVISMLWIIFGHSISFGQMWLFLRNSSNSKNLSIDFFGQIIANGTLSVDTFLFLSGFLVAYVSLKTMRKRDGKLNLPLFYFHRYIRMTPLMMAIIGFCACILRYVNQGPKWLEDVSVYDVWCKKNWWLNVLYIQNFVNTKNMCLSHTWYSAVDMQIYLITPIIIFALYKGRKFGFPVIGALFVLTITLTAYFTAVNNYPAIPYISNVVPLDLMNEYYAAIYIKPYCRLGPYLVGMLLGYFLYDWAEPVCLSKYLVATGWTACVATNLFIIYAMWPANKGILPTIGEATAYGALARTVWAITLAWVTFACVTGYGGFVNSMLSWRPFIPFSRLTYAAYLIHPVLMAIFYSSREIVFDFSPYLMLYFVIGNVVCTYILSFFLSAIFESPIIGLEKILLHKT